MMNKWLACFLVGLTRVMTYPIDILGQLVSLVTYLLIFLLVVSEGSVSAYTDLQFWSLMSVFFMAIYFPSGGLFSFDIRTGRIFLIEVLPISHLLRLHGQYAGQRIVYVFIAFCVFCALSLATFQNYKMLFLFPIFIALSFSAALLFELIVSSIAFAVPYFFGIGELKSKITLVFCGILLIPSDLPWGLNQLAYVTPFPWLVYEPSLAVLGRVEVFPVIAMQIFWFGILALFFRFVALPRIHLRLNSFDG